MFRTLRTFLPNPFDWMVKRTARKGGKKILLCWNRGLGDIALGLYAMVQRIREHIPDAEITFLTRENLRDGFSLLEKIEVLVDPKLKRGEKVHIDPALRAQFDLVIEQPSPTEWVRWQRGKVVPKLKWDPRADSLHKRFALSDRFRYVGVQVEAETQYGLWRNWPLKRWQELFDRLEGLEDMRLLLFGYGEEPKFSNRCLIDLRGKTNLFELLSIIKNRCMALILPDSGISSMIYYLNASFPLKHITLWADPDHGILKQAVPSPNPQLMHHPLVGALRDLSTVTVDAVCQELFPIGNAAAILLAGGQGTRLGFHGPKGLFSVGGKTLFEWFCKKVPKDRPVAIMTSPLNHEATVAYFKSQGNFGLDLSFFPQEMHPYEDEERRPLTKEGPNGNGSVFRSFVRAGLDKAFAEKGIDVVTTSYIENPLAKPFDPLLIEKVRSQNNDAVVQCIRRRPSDLPMGILHEEKGKLHIVEYTEWKPGAEADFAYSGQMAFRFPFFCKMASEPLPLHWVRKQVDGQWIWKGEQFIFDTLPFAERVGRLEVPRETHYAPIKTADHLAAVEKHLREIL